MSCTRDMTHDSCPAQETWLMTHVLHKRHDSCLSVLVSWVRLTLYTHTHKCFPDTCHDIYIYRLYHVYIQYMIYINFSWHWPSLHLTCRHKMSQSVLMYIYICEYTYMHMHILRMYMLYLYMWIYLYTYAHITYVYIVWHTQNVAVCSNVHLYMWINLYTYAYIAYVYIVCIRVHVWNSPMYIRICYVCMHMIQLAPWGRCKKENKGTN